MILTNAQTHIDKELFNRIAIGEEQAFTQLFVAYSKLLHPFVTELLGEAGLADEIIQQTFLNIWLKRDKLTNVDHPRAYIFKIAANECYMALRKKVRARQYLQQAASQEVSGNNTATRFSLQEVQQLIGKALAQLPDTQRQVFSLSRGRHYSIQEIADQLGLSPQTVKNNLSKALKQIRDFLEKAGYPLPAVLLLLIGA